MLHVPDIYLYINIVSKGTDRSHTCQGRLSMTNNLFTSITIISSKLALQVDCRPSCILRYTRDYMIGLSSFFF